jgi:hypothetical protein
MDEEQKEKLYQIQDKLVAAIDALKDGKPEDRSETARRFAVTITEMEKVLAYFNYFVVEEG